MQEKRFKDDSHDANIHLDWQSRSVKFTNSKSMFTRKVAVVLALSYPILIATFYLLAFLSVDTYKPAPVIPAPTMPSTGQLIFGPMLLTGVLGLVVVFAPIVGSSKRLIRFRLKREPYIVKIPNPSGVIEYDCQYNGNPLVELEFDDAVSAKLVDASMIAGANSKRKHRKRMVITMDGTANGVLTIKEYA